MSEKPLSAHARDALTTLRLGPRPRQEFNAGVNAVIEARGLVESFWRETPYKTRKGLILWLKLTEDGAREAQAITAAGSAGRGQP